MWVQVHQAGGERVKRERTFTPDGSFTETTTEQQTSIEVSRNAKGEFAWKVKVYNDDLNKIDDDLRQAKQIAVKHAVEG